MRNTTHDRTFPRARVVGGLVHGGQAIMFDPSFVLDKMKKTKTKFVHLIWRTRFLCVDGLLGGKVLMLLGGAAASAAPAVPDATVWRLQSDPSGEYITDTSGHQTGSAISPGIWVQLLVLATVGVLGWFVVPLWSEKVKAWEDRRRARTQVGGAAALVGRAAEEPDNIVLAEVVVQNDEEERPVVHPRPPMPIKLKADESPVQDASTSTFVSQDGSADGAEYRKPNRSLRPSTSQTASETTITQPPLAVLRAEKADEAPSRDYLAVAPDTGALG